MPTSTARARADGAGPPTAPPGAVGPAARGEVRDERMHSSGALRRLLNRPELGAVAGAITVFVFFAAMAGDSGFLTKAGTSTYLTVAAYLGILAVAVSLLMIAGEFDLSIGSMVGACSMTTAMLSSHYHWGVWPALAASLALALGLGFVNGLVVVRSGLPSFIVTLATLFILRGATIGISKAISGSTQVSGVDAAGGYGSAHTLFAGTIDGFSVSILWWVGAALLATWVLLRTRMGNWIFGTGGSAVAARNLGVPVARTKIVLFMSTAAAAWLVSTLEVVQFTGADVLRGQNREFEAIIAVVIGGTLLTGGYGSAIGAVFGALIFGMAQQGIVFAGAPADWYQAFLGAMLLAAVLVNSYIRRKAAETPR
jgi:simple sugar transport system permease protein